jgi:hypothetical protein
MSPRADQLPPDALKEALYPHLFPETDDGEALHTFVILDGAAIPTLLDRLYGERPEFICLYRGELEPDIAEVAPYLVRLEPDTPFADWVLAGGWGNHWGIFALSSTGLTAVRTHLRRFLTVKGPDGARLLFRYYDPRVLNVYLPTCNREELAVLFGPVHAYIAEAQGGAEMTRYGIAEGQLAQRKVRLQSPSDPQFQSLSDNGPQR